MNKEVQEKIIKKEEITDLVNQIKDRYTPENFAAMEIKKGKVLRFREATIRITKVAKDRYWGEHIELVDPKLVKSHYGHDVDSTEETIAEYGVPFCTDCELPVDQPATKAGDEKSIKREENTLEDGTVVE